MSNFMLE